MHFEKLADWLAWQEILHHQAIDLGLERVCEVQQRMGITERQPYTISVGGTNGKGSCVAMLDSILRQAGYRVGTYTSPHILRYNERIRLNGLPVDDDQIMGAFERIEAVREGASLSFFEFGTLAAMDVFSGSQLDIQILEVGLGGRLDAVNIVDADIALIASIDIDHEEWLGYTRDSIAQEKSGIFRSGKPAVIGDPDVPDPMIAVAAKLKSPLYRQGLEFGYECSNPSWDWWGHGGRLCELPLPAIPGEHQLMNASAVLQSLHLANEAFPVSGEHVRRGLEKVNLQGRFQFFPGKIPVLIDVAHNPHAVRALAKHLRNNYAEKRISAVFSVMRDKDIPAMIDIMSEVVDSWYLVPLKMARAATPDELYDVIRKAGIKRVNRGFDGVVDAFGQAHCDARSGDLLLVFGSFFLVSDYLAQVAGKGGY